MNITSKDTMLFRKEFEGKVHYRMGLSTKKQDNTYEKAYIDVKMPKDANIPDKTKININKGFLSFYNYTDKEGKKKTTWYIVVQEYSVNVQVQASIKYDENDELGTSFTVEQLDASTPELPF